MQDFRSLTVTPQFQIVSTDDVLEVPGPVQARVDAIWEEEEQRLGEGLFDGQLLSATAVDASRLVGRFVSYRYFLAQLCDPSLSDVLDIHAVAVTGVTWDCKDRLLVGQRAHKVTQHPDMYELAPSGGIDPSTCSGGVIDYCSQILQELQEEATVTAAHVIAVKPWQLVYECSRSIWELALEVQLSGEAVPLYNPAEYRKLLWIARSDIAAFLKEYHEQVVPLTAYVCRQIVSAAEENTAR